MIYMLNLTFDPTDTEGAAYGRFKPYDHTLPLLSRSKVWLQSAESNPDPDTGVWTYKQKDTGQGLPAVWNQDQIWIRVLIQTSSGTTTGWEATFATVFARNAKEATKDSAGNPYQERSSPFPIQDEPNCSKVLLQFTTPQSSYGSFCQQLGLLTLSTRVPPP